MCDYDVTSAIIIISSQEWDGLDDWIDGRVTLGHKSTLILTEKIDLFSEWHRLIRSS